MFKELCPYYMSLGMTYEQYWDGDVWMVRDFRKSHKLRLEAQNRHAYLQGMYVYSAIASMVPVLRPFSKARKPNDYLKEPIKIFYGESKWHPLTEKENAEREAMLLEKERFLNFARQFNQRFEQTKAANVGKSDGKEVSENGG